MILVYVLKKIYSRELEVSDFLFWFISSVFISPGNKMLNLPEATA
jgi:hypothetical protein